ncbi:site-specific DNA-methyltransferase [Campylobacter sp.]|uniref:site-specific DNA-methyltransferase n=1 Tax=Campylobacter sp. TaxID=205 RepID=UPI00259CDA8F|nr:site-specific DNA-methyltransferase [Campylobacter sp.]
MDPPYNTGNDSFNYNDRFNHSTWLTFMKNRLEIARELLRDDGVIFVQCDDNEQAYLKVLMDEIFGRENFVACGIWNSISSVLKQSKFIRKEHEFILIYAKNKLNLKFNKLENSMKFENLDNDPNGAWFSSNAASPNQKSKTNFFGIKLPNGEICERNWKFTYEEFINGEVSLYFKDGNVPRLKIYEKDYDKNTAIQSSIFIDLGSITTAKTELKYIFKDDLFATPKPEALIKRIIEISTNENDLVLDFFAGSGTTLAVAHKMKRRYIGIEQMDYIEPITKERLKKVIDGEQGGISKAVSWSGGGSLIYCELANLNAKFIDMIENSSDENELNQIYEKLIKFAFIDYRVDIQNDLKDLEFAALEFIEKKRILKKCLDRNMDYIPYTDMEDSDYKIDERTKKLNDIFYKGSSDE